MTPADKAALRALAEAAINSWGVVETTEYRHAMSETHPAAVLSLLDEVERLREALEFVLRGIKTNAIKAQPVLDIASGSVLTLQARIAAALEPRA